MNASQLRACTGASWERAETFAPFLTDAMHEFGIDTPTRQAAFLPQVGHESGGLKWLVEIWGPTAAQLGYEGRADLGNTKPGDGSRFRGRGLIQLTGRANYERAGPPLGYDLINFPQRLALPGPAARSACWFWQVHHLNALADAGDFDGVCDVINRGHKTERFGDANGFAERQRLWKLAKNVLGVQP